MADMAGGNTHLHKKILKESWKHNMKSIGIYKAKFVKRQKEISELIKITDKIKKYIVDNKESLLKARGEDELKIQNIVIANRPKRVNNMKRNGSWAQF
jgi:adenylosuccinate synthase